MATAVMLAPFAWFAWTAPPLGPHPYRWGRFIGAMALASALVQALAVLAASTPPSWYFPALHFAIAVGILKRLRWGPIFLLADVVLFVIRAALSAGSLFPLDILTAVLVLGANTWYFAKRWKWMGWP